MQLAFGMAMSGLPDCRTDLGSSWRRAAHCERALSSLTTMLSDCSDGSIRRNVCWSRTSVYSSTSACMTHNNYKSQLVRSMSEPCTDLTRMPAHLKHTHILYLSHHLACCRMECILPALSSRQGAHAAWGSCSVLARTGECNSKLLPKRALSWVQHLKLVQRRQAVCPVQCLADDDQAGELGHGGQWRYVGPAAGLPVQVTAAHSSRDRAPALQTLASRI